MLLAPIVPFPQPLSPIGPCLCFALAPIVPFAAGAWPKLVAPIDAMELGDGDLAGPASVCQSPPLYSSSCGLPRSRGENCSPLPCKACQGRRGGQASFFFLLCAYKGSAPPEPRACVIKFQLRSSSLILFNLSKIEMVRQIDA